ncbi:MAG: DUF2335 domain-containing protein, partial [Gloeotrichia echinulata HAB0833]
MAQPSKQTTKIASEQQPDSSRAVLVHHEYSGILPHPEEFKAFDEVVPGAAERILAMAEQQSV